VESVFPLNFFVDGRDTTTPAQGRKLGLDDGLLFFRDHKFPADFHRASIPSGTQGINVVIATHPIAPGGNADGKVNNYVVDPTSADFGKFCQLYQDFVTKTVVPLYPNPKGILRRNLIVNLHYFYEIIDGNGCEEVFPYGRS
jgi:hypothetical protein